MKTVVLKQSREWWSCAPGLQWIIDNADFAFVHSGNKGNRVKVVTKTTTGEIGFNCFEIDNDQYGITVCSESVYDPEFHKSYAGYTETSGAGIIVMLIGFLVKWGAEAYVTNKIPKVNIFKRISNFFDKRKDVVIEIKYSLAMKSVKTRLVTGKK